MEGLTRTFAPLPVLPMTMPLLSLPGPRTTLVGLSLAIIGHAGAAELPYETLASFLDSHCYECHDEDVQKGDLDLTTLGDDLSRPGDFLAWSHVFERVEKGEMPPEKKPRPSTDALSGFLDPLLDSLVAVETELRQSEGRSPLRRLNRTEYENTLKELLDLPYLDVASSLPPEGSAHHFDK